MPVSWRTRIPDVVNAEDLAILATSWGTVTTQYG